MGLHEQTVLDPPHCGVALDVASRVTWAGPANPDARHFAEHKFRELPWPIRFGFVLVGDDDGRTRWAIASIDIGRPIGRDEEGLDTSEFEVTRERFRKVYENFDRYRLYAEHRLIPTDEGLERARQIRRAMLRRPGEAWTRDSLSVLVEHWRALADAAGDDRMYVLAESWGISRSAVHRALERADMLGVLKPGEWQRRSS